MNRITHHIRHSLQDMYPPEEARALAMMICCDILGLNALDIYAGKDINLSESKQRELENILERLRKNEPIQYIRGVADFCGRTFQVAPGVLIPRPETSELVELVIRENTGAIRILDIGTGSGCIAISLDKGMPEAEVTAWDVSDEALSVARRNNERLDARVKFVKQDVLATDIAGDCLFDVIVSNPPYITEAEKQNMDANVLDWEPGLALFVPDDNPLLFYIRIAELGWRFLTPGGRLYFEINQAYGKETVAMLEHNHYRNIRVIKDLFGKDRIVVADR